MAKKKATEMTHDEVIDILDRTAKIYAGMDYICMLSLIMLLIEDALKKVPDAKTREGFYSWLIEEFTKQKENINSDAN